ncbi:MAG: CapA family protein [Erysipelotrichaceae bacterium]|nr:CapA family protein [Erysipelotrichaceae bacterium]
MSEKKGNQPGKKSPKSRIRWDRLIIAGAVVLIPAALCIWGISSVIGMFTSRPASENGASQTSASGSDQVQAKQKNSQKKTACKPEDGYDKCFTFTGVGDNLIHETLFEGDEEYKQKRDFSVFYENIAPYMQNSDLAYINFETLCAGDEFGFSGYPDFNAPKEIIDALDDAGLNWFSLASNHCLDRYPEGLLAELKDIEQNHTGVTYTGVYSSQENSQKPVILDINGIKVGLATFAYGLNGRDKPEGYEWMIDTFQDNYGVIDYDLLDKRMADLTANSDIQIVSMHWGTEYQTEPSDLQMQMAQYVADRGADVIIGTHPHVIQPVNYLTPDGSTLKTSEQTTAPAAAESTDSQSTEHSAAQTANKPVLVYWSLGNFISNQADLPTMVGGMAQFQVNLNSKTGDILITDPTFTPTITWYDSGDHNFKGTTIAEYTDELAATHGLTAEGHDMTLNAVKNHVTNIVGQPEGIEIILDPNSTKLKK